MHRIIVFVSLGKVFLSILLLICPIIANLCILHPYQLVVATTSATQGELYCVKVYVASCFVLFYIEPVQPIFTQEPASGEIVSLRRISLFYERVYITTEKSELIIIKWHPVVVLCLLM